MAGGVLDTEGRRRMAKAGSHLTDTSLESGESLTEVFATCSGDKEGVGECRELGRALRA